MHFGMIRTSVNLPVQFSCKSFQLGRIHFVKYGHNKSDAWSTKKFRPISDYNRLLRNRTISTAAMLRDYPASLMKIRDTCIRVENSQPGQKDEAAKIAGMDFVSDVGVFEMKYGSLLK